MQLVYLVSDPRKHRGGMESETGKGGQPIDSKQVTAEGHWGAIPLRDV